MRIDHPPLRGTLTRRRFRIGAGIASGQASQRTQPGVKPADLQPLSVQLLFELREARSLLSELGRQGTQRLRPISVRDRRQQLLLERPGTRAGGLSAAEPIAS
jgi:hypothetical protein